MLLSYRIWPFSWLHMVGTIQVTLENYFSVITSKQSRTQLRLSQSLYALREICCPSAWLISSCNGAPLWFLSAAPEVPHQSHILVLYWPNAAYLQLSNGIWCFQHGLGYSIMSIEPRYRYFNALHKLSYFYSELLRGCCGVYLWQLLTLPIVESGTKWNVVFF